MKKLILSLLCLWAIVTLCGSDTTVADNVRKIKLQGDAYWWDASTLPWETVHKNPQSIAETRAMLSSSIAIQIKSFVQGSISHSEAEAQGMLSSQTSQNVLISSSMYLENLKFLEYRDKKQYHVFAYLLRSDYNAQEEKLATRLQSIVGQALELEQIDPDGAMYLYYKAYLMSHSLTKAVHCALLNSDLQVGLEKKLRDILANLPLRSRLFPEANSIGVELQIASNASGYMVSIPSLNFYNLNVTGGKCSFFYDSIPTKRIEELKLILSINPAWVENEPELKEIAKNISINIPRLLGLDFSQFIQADFSYEAEGDSYTFSPHISGISVKTIDWELGDGNRISSVKPILHSYQHSGIFPVKMLINSDISVIHTIEVKSKVVAIEPPLPPVENIPAPITAGANDSENLSENAKSLLDITNSRELLAWLQKQKKANVLTWGRINKSTPLQDMWVVVWDASDTIVAVLSPQNDIHYDLIGICVITDIHNSFKNLEAVYISYF